MVERRAGHLGQRQRCRHRRWDKLGVRDGGEWDEKDTVAELFGRLGRHLDGETGLPGTARAGEGEETGAGQQFEAIRQLLLPPDEARQLEGKVVWVGIHRLELREPTRELWVVHLIDPFRLSQVLEPVQPQIGEAHRRW